MKTVLLTETEFLVYRNQISQMLWEVLAINLPDACYTHEQCEEKTNELLRYLKEEKAIVAAAIEDDIIGFLWAYRRAHGTSERMHLNHIIVKQNYRSQNIGTLLLEFLERHAIQQGVSGIELWATASNQAAMNFYAKNHFSAERIQFFKPL